MRLLAPSFVALALAGCPFDNDGPIPEQVDPAQCLGTGYTAFDVANHAEQDARVGAYTEIKRLLEEVVEDPSLAAARFATAQALYQSSAELQGKVQGRTDDHIEGRPNVGADIDARISAAFSDGAAATTSLQAAVAAETIDKALVEFFFLSVFHELVQGQAAKWDEAYGYYGSGPDNALDAVQGFAAVAKKRDANNGTALEAAIFQNLVDGSCALAGKLSAQEVETIDVLNDAELSVIIEDIDVAMREVLAYSVAHEAFVIADVQGTLAATPDDVAAQEEARITLVELNAFFLPLERLMRAEGDVADADALRAPIDAALADDTAAWIDAFDAAAVIADVEAHFAIDVLE